MRIYTITELKKLKKIKNIITSNCKKCNGTCTVKKHNDFYDCDCLKRFIWVKELVFSNIPKKYWNLELEKLNIDNKHIGFISNYISKLENAIEYGLSIFFHGTNGTGKTSLMCELGKLFIINQLSTFYITVDQFINMSFLDDSETKILNERILNSDTLIIDEFEKAYKKNGNTYLDNKLEKLIRHFNHENRILIIGSNIDKDEIKKQYNESIISLLQEIKFLNISGNDHRVTRGNDWEKMLNDKNEFLSESINKSSKQFCENREKKELEDFNQFTK